MSTIRQAPRPKFILWPDGQRYGRLDLSRYLVSLQVSHPLNAPNGSWSAELAWYRRGGSASLAELPDPQLMRNVRAGGLVSIGVDEPGGLLLGMVDSVRWHRSPGSGEGRLSLQGSDLGKLLARDNIVRAQIPEHVSWTEPLKIAFGPDHPLVHELIGVWGGSRRAPLLKGSSVEEVLKYVLNFMPTARIPMLAAFGGSGMPGEYIRTDGSILVWNAGKVWTDVATGYQGTVYEFLRRVLDEDFYEIFLACVPNGTEIPQVRLVVRPKPFDEPAMQWLPVASDPFLGWETLTTLVDGLRNHVIDRSEVTFEDLSYSDSDVYSFVLAQSQTDLGAAAYPALDVWAMRRYGLRPYYGTLNLLAGDLRQRSAQLAEEGIVSETTEARNRLYNWYRLNSYMVAGQLTVAGRDRYRVGDPVYLPWFMPPRVGLVAQPHARGCRFYVAATSWAWSRGAAYTTSLTLTRGHNRAVIDQAKLEIGAEVPELVAQQGTIKVF